MRVKPKKSLGQNFLSDKNILNKLISAYGLKTGGHVLEIGSGYGELTKLLGASGVFVIAVEIDTRLCGILEENVRDYPNIKILNRDILGLDLDKHFGKLKGKIKVVGNIPYYITTPIIEYLFKYRKKIEAAFITVQKEFAARIVALPGSKGYGSFSCFVQYYSQPCVLFPIKKGSFSPAPKVDSCAIGLAMREVPAVDVEDEKILFKIIRSAFNQRRKTLRNSLKGIIAQDKLEDFFRECRININARPEDISLQNFSYLANKV